MEWQWTKYNFKVNKKHLCEKVTWVATWKCVYLDEYEHAREAEVFKVSKYNIFFFPPLFLKWHSLSYIDCWHEHEVHYGLVLQWVVLLILLQNNTFSEDRILQDLMNSGIFNKHNTSPVYSIRYQLNK